MSNAKNVGQEIKSCLLIGSTGGGKTSQFLTYPGKKYALLFDTNAIATLRGHDIEYDEYIPEHLDLDVVTLKTNVRDKFSKAPEPKTYITFERDLEEKMRTNYFEDYDSIMIDSTTMFTDIVMDRVLWLNGRFGKQPEMADYAACTNTIIKVYRTLLGFRKPILITGHIEFQKDETTQRFQNTLAFLGQLRRRIPLMFNEVWLAYGEPNRDGKMSYYVRTRQDRQNQFLRCTSEFVETVENVTLDYKKPLESQGVGALLDRTVIASGG